MTKYNDSLGDRMKSYEKQPLVQRFDGTTPIIARVDGRAFHTFTKDLNRPYDIGFLGLMTRVTKELLRETQAKLAYTQSDEITLVFEDRDLFMAGRAVKMISLIASLATAHFNRYLPQFLPAKDTQSLGPKLVPVFDCRVFTVPNRVEAANCLVWRVHDAKRNAIQAVARCVFSTKEIHGKSSKELLDMLKNSPLWNDYCPSGFKYGRFVQPCVVARKFKDFEVEHLPPEHDARQNPELVVKRSEMRVIPGNLAAPSLATGILEMLETQPTEIAHD